VSFTRFKQLSQPYYKDDQLEERYNAALTLADNANDAEDLKFLLDVFGLPPSDREVQLNDSGLNSLGRPRGARLAQDGL
jgi:hypothetical protein